MEKYLNLAQDLRTDLNKLHSSVSSLSATQTALDLECRRRDAIG